MNRLGPALAISVLILACQRAISSGPTAAGAGAPLQESPPAAGGAPLVYVSNEESTEISVIDSATDTLMGNIFVGKRPRGIKIGPDGNTLYVALSGSPMAPPGTDESKLPPPDRSADGIAVVDMPARRLVRTLSTGEDPESFDFTADGKTLYVSNEDAATVTVLSLPSGRIISTVAVGGEPEGVRLRPDGKVVYVTSEEDNEVAVIDTTSNRLIAKIPTGARPRGIVFTRDGTRAYISAEQGGSVTLVDAAQHVALMDIRIEAKGAKPMGMAISPSGETVYVSCGRGGVVALIDVASNRVTKIIEGVGTRPWGIGLTLDGKKLYTANGPSNDVSVIDVATGTVVKKIPAGKGPWGVAISR